jgi:hypothetical protein
MSSIIAELIDGMNFSHRKRQEGAYQRMLFPAPSAKSGKESIIRKK